MKHHNTQRKEQTFELPDQLTEQLILNRLLLSKIHLLSIMSVFDERWFECVSSRVVSKIVVSYFRKFHALPTITNLKNILTKYSEKRNLDREKLFSVIDAALKNNIFAESPEFADSVIQDFVKRRGIYYTIMDNLDNIEKKKDVTKLISKFGELANFDIDQDLGIDGFNTEAHREASIKNIERVPTGIFNIDKQFDGGLLRTGKCLWVPIGMPGVGKTTLLTNLAKNFILQGEKVVIITMEIDQDIYLKRVDANILNIKISSVTEKFKEISDTYNKLKHEKPEVGLVIKEFPPRTVNTATVKLFLERLRITGFTPTVILIDYLNLLLPFTISPAATMYERVGAVAQEIRALSWEFNAPVVSPTQFNTEGYTGEPGMENIAESRAVAHHADALTALWQSETDREQNIINWKHIKNRLGGRIGIRKTLNINYNSLKLTDLDDKTNTDSNKITSEDNIKDLLSL